MNMKKSFSSVLKDNTMVIVLVLVFLFFTWQTGGAMFEPLKFNNLVTQNAYVYILASGMLMCMLTGGNIDLSCGSFVCFLGAIGAFLMVNLKLNAALAIILMLLIGIVYGSVLGFLIAYVDIPPWIATLAGFLAFRGLGTQILSGASSTSSINVKAVTGFMAVFSGKLFS
ncbi:MAG: sugar ABC transporter permease, partial [Blautia sp.]|nr:sugar ABC transporter permease [Blautia sp.]